MKFIMLISAAIVLLTMSRTSAMTNEEFFKLVQPYAADIEEYNIDEDDSDALEANDVITLPGSPDDDVDFEYLMDSLDLLNETKEVAARAGMPSWLTHYHTIHHHHYHTHHIHHNHHYHHHHYHQRTFHCTCSHYNCKCCLYRTFRIHMHFKRIHFGVNVCLTISYPHSNVGLEHTLTVDGQRLYHKEISANEVQVPSETELYEDSDNEQRRFLWDDEQPRIAADPANRRRFNE